MSNGVAKARRTGSRLAKEMSMSNFHNLAATLQAMAAAAEPEPDAAAVRPLVIGEGVMAGLLRSGKSAGGLHRQPNHEELLIVLEGEADFRVGDEVRRVRPGDFIFVPRDAVHSTVAIQHEPLSFLSVIAPRIDLAKDMIWENEPLRFRMV
jgi:quercetin dioxygenase-like cupin family protein